MNMLDSISSYNFVEINGYAYFSNLFYNAIFKVEIKTGKTTFLGSFDGEKFSDTNIHFEVMHREDKIYFFPRRGNHVHVYYLSEETMRVIEVQKKNKSFLGIEKVILNDDFIYFFPKQKNSPIKKMKWDTCKITNANNKFKIQGKKSFKYKKGIPSGIIEKYQIKYGEMVSCKSTTDGRWYCFKPIGRQILFFTEETNELKSIVLTVVNELELEKYLYKVKQNLFQSSTFFNEFKNFRFKEFIEAVTLSSELKENSCKGKNDCNINNGVWKMLKG